MAIKRIENVLDGSGVEREGQPHYSGLDYSAWTRLPDHIAKTVRAYMSAPYNLGYIATSGGCQYIIQTDGVFKTNPPHVGERIVGPEAERLFTLWHKTWNGDQYGISLEGTLAEWKAQGWLDSP